jgi:hypothetical protein
MPTIPAQAFHPGDAHLIRPGLSHYAVAGPQGARFMTIAVRVGQELTRP